MFLQGRVLHLQRPSAEVCEFYDDQGRVMEHKDNTSCKDTGLSLVALRWKCETYTSCQVDLHGLAHLRTNFQFLTPRVS